jgi:uncharacterized protein
MLRERTTIAGPAGALEIVIEGATHPRALALVCHPHPLFSGTMDNKVVTTLSKAFEELGCAVARFNFRGVGKSEGVHDEGRGEIDDALAALAHLRNTCGADLPIFLAGFSFGSVIAAQSFHRFSAQTAPQVGVKKLILVGPAVSRFQMPTVPDDTVVIQGEADEVVPLADVLNWARPQALPVTVFPGSTHFFHGQLVALKKAVTQACLF